VQRSTTAPGATAPSGITGIPATWPFAIVSHRPLRLPRARLFSINGGWADHDHDQDVRGSVWATIETPCSGGNAIAHPVSHSASESPSWCPCVSEGGRRSGANSDLDGDQGAPATASGDRDCDHEVSRNSCIARICDFVDVNGRALRPGTVPHPSSHRRIRPPRPRGVLTPRLQGKAAAKVPHRKWASHIQCPARPNLKRKAARARTTKSLVRKPDAGRATQAQLSSCGASGHGTAARLVRTE
jgi:hypothetical protein